MKDKIMVMITTKSNETSKYNIYRLADYNSAKSIINEHLKLLEIFIELDELSIEEINKKLEKANSDIRIDMFINYDKRFQSFEEKCKFRDAIEHIATNNHCINDNTMFIWDYERSEWSDAGSWAWSNNIEDIIDYYKYVILERLLSFVYEGAMTIEERDTLGLSDLLQI